MSYAPPNDIAFSAKRSNKKPQFLVPKICYLSLPLPVKSEMFATINKRDIQAKREKNKKVFVRGGIFLGAPAARQYPLLIPEL